MTLRQPTWLVAGRQPERKGTINIRVLLSVGESNLWIARRPRIEAHG